MQVKEAFQYPDRVVEKGEILGVESESTSGLVFILDGALKCRSVHLSHLEEIDLGKLVEDLRVAQDDEKRAVAAADRLEDNVIQLQRENKRLMDEVDEARKANKVMLPREVAEALDFFKNEGVDADAVMRWVECNADGKNIDIIKRFIRHGKGYDIARAFVNGYTVEHPEIDREQQLRLDVRQLMDSWDGRRKRELVENVDELLTDYFKEIST
ncbi:hypothetical protein [Paenibacillus harenae]|nr:hypothetical protein [Paenibacillus harenae]